MVMLCFVEPYELFILIEGMITKNYKAAVIHELHSRIKLSFSFFLFSFLNGTWDDVANSLLGHLVVLFHFIFPHADTDCMSLSLRCNTWKKSVSDTYFITSLLSHE